MAKIEFPQPLKQLLEESDLQAPIRAFADRAGEIFANNVLSFFPDYTDHGTDHINNVLKSEVELVPKPVWETSKKDSDPRLLCDADAVVLIGATLLHDIAMHLYPGGFRELVSKDSLFQPLAWFKESHEGHSADRPWQELWEDYVREARRFSDRDLANIIGEASAGVWKFHDLPEDAGQWERNHCLIIGEFIRRHHARLAHEIAIYGFPGLPVGSGEGQFPAMGTEEGHPLRLLADLIGLTARSHGMSLRVCKSYLDDSSLYSGTPRPRGTVVFYSMALLRVADYLQIDQKRTPAVLLKLRNPQSPISVQEWKKHRAVQNIVPATAPRSKMITVSTDLPLSLYLQLRDLLAGLQAEMDHSTVVLDEVYGTRSDLGLHQLNLATLRVDSNLNKPQFRDNLPYVPDRTGFTADPNLLTLLVEPLYGKQPSVGVRELMQNAVDAVCELEAWRTAHGKSIESLDLPEQDDDVLIEFIKQENGAWFLRVRDRGIGMRSDTIQNYFLRAGASFRRSAEWSKEFLDEKGQPRVARAGRFGIGAFAIFLLGPSFRLWTRHADADKSMGYRIEVSTNSHLIEIRRDDSLPVGTTIEVELGSETVQALKLEEEKYSLDKGPQPQLDWFCWDWPKVVKRVVRGKDPEILMQEFSLPLRKEKLPPEWAIIRPEGFDAVYWTFSDSPMLSCNGLKVAEPSASSLRDAEFAWPEETQLRRPHLAILDSAANLPLTIQRYRLSQETVPFIDELARDVMLSFIAHALVCGPTSCADALSFQRWYPLMSVPSSFNTRGGFSGVEKLFSNGCRYWCTTSAEVVPADVWLYSLLNSETCVAYGDFGYEVFVSSDLLSTLATLTERVAASGFAILSWPGKMARKKNTVLLVGIIGNEEDEETKKRKRAHSSREFLANLARHGVTALGHEVEASQILVSTTHDFASRDATFWSKIHSPNSQRFWFEAKTGAATSCLSLNAELEVMEAAFLRDSKEDRRFPQDEPMPDVLYAAEIKTKRVARSPESLIARIWNECLGPRAIPFDAVARQALIAEACKHPELKRHIEAWQEMQRSGSKWATNE